MATAMKPCTGCGRNLALVGRVHRCVPPLSAPVAPAAPGSGRSIVASLVTEVPRRIDFQRIGGRRSSRLTRVMVNGKVVIPKTRSPFAMFGALLVQGWSGDVELWRDKKRIGVRNIEAEARRIVAAHDALILRKRRSR